jgi:hypothetical protein
MSTVARPGPRAPGATRPASAHGALQGRVVAVAADATHRFSKPLRTSITLPAGLLAALLSRDTAGRVVRKARVMGVVLHDGVVQPGDTVRVELPAPPHRALQRV